MAVLILHQAPDEGAMERRLAGIVELTKAHSVEADQAVLRAQPQKTVSRLQDRVDRRLKQSFFLAPDPMRVLRQGFIRIKRDTRPPEAQSQKSTKQSRRSAHY